MASASPRIWATSSAGRSRPGTGRRARLPRRPGASGPKLTCRSRSAEIARVAAVSARLNGSVGLSGLAIRATALLEIRLGCGLWQFLAEAALVAFSHPRALQFVAFVQEGQPERETDIAEYAGILGPGDHRTRAHHGRDVAVDEAGPGQFRHRHHVPDRRLALLA